PAAERLHVTGDREAVAIALGQREQNVEEVRLQRVLRHRPRIISNHIIRGNITGVRPPRIGRPRRRANHRVTEAQRKNSSWFSGTMSFALRLGLYREEK